MAEEKSRKMRTNRNNKRRKENNAQKRANPGEQMSGICAQTDTPFFARSLGVLFCILFYAILFIPPFFTSISFAFRDN